MIKIQITVGKLFGRYIPKTDNIEVEGSFDIDKISTFFDEFEDSLKEQEDIDTIYIQEGKYVDLIISLNEKYEIINIVMV